MMEHSPGQESAGSRPEHSVPADPLRRRGPSGYARWRMDPDRDTILKALENVIDPELRRPVTELDMVREIEIDGGDVSVTIALTVAGCPLRESFQSQVVEHVGTVPGVERVRLGFDVMSAEERTALSTKLRGGVAERSKGISVDRN